MRPGWPINIEDNVELVGGLYWIRLPVGDYSNLGIRTRFFNNKVWDVNKFTKPEAAKYRIAELNEIVRKIGGRPAKPDVDAKQYIPELGHRKGTNVRDKVDLPHEDVPHVLKEMAEMINENRDLTITGKPEVWALRDRLRDVITDPESITAEVRDQLFDVYNGEYT